MASMLLPQYRYALNLLKRQSGIMVELVELDTSTGEGKARRAELQQLASQIGADMGDCQKECGKIHGLVADSADADLTILTLTEIQLAQFLETA